MIGGDGSSSEDDMVWYKVLLGRATFSPTEIVSSWTFASAISTTDGTLFPIRSSLPWSGPRHKFPRRSTLSLWALTQSDVRRQTMGIPEPAPLKDMASGKEK